MGGGWEVPVLLIMICAFLVNQHPQLVDDCPCFEDAIAFASVCFGALLGKWVMLNFEFDTVLQTHVVMPGSGWFWDSNKSSWMQIERGWEDVALWWSVAALKMILGKQLNFVCSCHALTRIVFRE